MASGMASGMMDEPLSEDVSFMRQKKNYLYVENVGHTQYEQCSDHKHNTVSELDFVCRQANLTTVGVI